MKRRPSLPLFKSIEPEVYVIDTSSWVNIDARADAEDVWTLVVTLIEQGRSVACAQVLGELRDNPFYLSRLKPYEDALKAGDGNNDDPAYLQHVGRITMEHPGMCKPTGWKTRADPYVVALAELEKHVVVADETLDNRPNRKIPGVCRTRGIRCITLDEFVREARASLEKKP